MWRRAARNSRRAIGARGPDGQSGERGVRSGCRHARQPGRSHSRGRLRRSDSPRRCGSAQASSDDAISVAAARKAWVTLAPGQRRCCWPCRWTREMGALDHALMRHAALALRAAAAAPVRWSLLVMTAALMAWAGRSIYSNAWRALRHGATNMNTLVSLGTGVAFAWSAYATLWPAPGRPGLLRRGVADPGIPAAGQEPGGRAKRRALAALDSLARLRPVTARRIVDGIETVVPLEEIQPGDSVLVLPGERFRWTRRSWKAAPPLTNPC